MDVIQLSDLADYREDRVTLRRFQLRYLLPTMVGYASALFGFLVLISEIDAYNHPDEDSATRLSTAWHKITQILHHLGLPHAVFFYLPAALFVFGLIVLAWVMVAMARALPVSQISGQKMEKYLSADNDPGTIENIYVDFESRTYFRRVATIFNPGPSIFSRTAK